MMKGEQFDFTMRGVAAEVNGELVGISGVLHTQPMQLFSTLDDRIRKYPRLFVMAAKRLREIMDMYEAPLLATSDGKVGQSVAFLEYIGFHHLRDNIYVR